MLKYIILMIIAFSQSEITEVRFGNGGGFTGISYNYILDSKGHLFELNPFTKERKLIDEIDIERTKEVFELIDASKLYTIDITQPGNIYKYIEINIDDQTHRIVWTGKSNNNSVNLIYKKLKTLRQVKE